MRHFILCFKSDQDGAVTVDWVVLTAGILALPILVVINLVNSGVVLSAEAISSMISEANK